MSELANYSIETDHTVLLAFKDGRRLRVPVGQLPHHLAPPDLAKVRAAIKLRRDFIRRHMPKAALVLMAGGLIALLAMGGQIVANMISAPRPVPPPPDHTGIVRSQELPTPVETPASPPVVRGAAVAVAGSVKPRVIPSKRLAHKLSGQAKPPEAPSLAPHVTPLPSVVPSPVPSATPSPSASPDPTSNGLAKGNPQPNQPGQVLGDCTSPNPTDPACTGSGTVTPQIP